MTLPIPLSPPRLHRLPGLCAFGATDVGTVRRSNEDNFLLDEMLGLAMLADGMGGHAAGEVASAGVLTELRGYLALHAPGLPTAGADAFQDTDPDATWSDPAAGAVRLLHAAVTHANARLYEQNCERNRADGGGMGTTLTGFWRASGTAPLVSFHVGDSRLYRLRAGVLEQLTRDQTLYQQALEAGMLDKLPARNLLLQAVGPSRAITPEVRSHVVMPGDVLMLCSDGLHGSVPHADIEGVLARADEDRLVQACDRLIEMAKSNGGRDNITVVVALCDAGDLRN
jgi:serine/threonine protein phosphatase PrpC